jgi:hypothetical protein
MPRQTDLTDRTAKPARQTDLGRQTDLSVRTDLTVASRPGRQTDLDDTVDRDFREFHTDLVEREPVSPPSPDAAPEIAYFKDLDLSGLGFGAFQKVGKLYFAPFDRTVRVQSPTLALASDLTDGDATLKISGSFRKFVDSTEAALFGHAVAHPEWTNKPEADLRRYFKSFVTGDEVRVKIADDLAVFDADGHVLDPEDVHARSTVRCILELDGICFGRRGFGAMWTLTQAQVVGAPRMLISDRARRERRADEFS